MIVRTRLRPLNRALRASAVARPITSSRTSYSSATMIVFLKAVRKVADSKIDR